MLATGLILIRSPQGPTAACPRKTVASTCVSRPPVLTCDPMHAEGCKFYREQELMLMKLRCLSRKCRWVVLSSRTSKPCMPSLVKPPFLVVDSLIMFRFMPASTSTSVCCRWLHDINNYVQVDVRNCISLCVRSRTCVDVCVHVHASACVGFLIIFSTIFTIIITNTTVVVITKDICH